MAKVKSAKTAAAAAAATKRKKSARRVENARAYINASFNNTLVGITDEQGNVLVTKSAGQAFRGSRKSTPFAAQQAALSASEFVQQTHGTREIEVIVSGAGPGREAAIKALAAGGIKVKMIKDMTPIPFNGCRPRKKRRV